MWETTRANPTLAGLRSFLALFPQSERLGEIESIANEILKSEIKRIVSTEGVTPGSAIVVDIPAGMEPAASPIADVSPRTILIRDAYKLRWAAVLEVHSNPARPFTLTGPFGSIRRAAETGTQMSFEVVSGSGYVVVKEVELAPLLTNPPRVQPTAAGVQRVYAFLH